MFINCHLDAKAAKSQQRIESYQKLTKALRFGIVNMESIFLYDHVFFIGDFNFRINKTFEDTVEMSNKGLYEEILEYD